VTGRIHALLSGVRTFSAAAMLERLWPSILMESLRRPGFKEKPVSQLLSSTRRALIMVPHPDDEFFGCPNLLLSLTRSGTKMTLAVVTDGSRQPADGPVSRLDMACNVAKLNGWDFAHVGLCDGFGEHPAAHMVGLLASFLHPYLAKTDGIDLIIMPLWSDYHALPRSSRYRDGSDQKPHSPRRLPPCQWNLHSRWNGCTQAGYLQP
jgi:hypothetical protein